MTESGPPNWERAVLEKVALQAVQEQRRARQWNALFKLLWFTIAFLVIAGLMGWIGRPDKDSTVSVGRHTAVVDVEGVIGVESKASAERVIKGLNRAFKDSNTVGVVLRINSPGGSPVQAGYVNDEIRRLRAKHPEIPLHAVVQDLCASGGYYIAVAADKIYVDKASLVGSIGVIMGSFGFVGTLDKLGMERRSYTSGDNKDFLDPFQPENPAHREHAQKMLSEIHAQFINVVRQGRGSRLKETTETFSGLIWTGEKSIELGLADSLGSTEFVAREVIKAEKLVDYTVEENYFEALSKRLGTSFGATFARAAAQAAARAALEVR
ncbi:MAG: S49 family peptidase [Pseudomonadota bacterium]|nr:S49 family peptidase [Pseudomonadota bacterium]